MEARTVASESGDFLGVARWVVFFVAGAMLALGVLRPAPAQALEKPGEEPGLADAPAKAKFKARGALPADGLHELWGRLTGQTARPRLEVAGEGDGGGAGTACQACLRGSVGCNASVQGDLRAGDCQLQDGSFFDVYAFALAEPQQVDIQLSSRNFNAFLFLTNANCEVLATNDDANGTDSRLVVLLPADNYFLVANSFAAGEVGPYVLGVGCSEITLCRDCLVGPISCGEAVHGNLPTSGCQLGDGSFLDIFRFELTEPGTVNIALESEQFNTFLVYFDGSCVARAVNDDCEPPTLVFRSCLNNLPVAAGTHYIGVNSAAGGEVGSYSLGFELAGGCVAGVTGNFWIIDDSQVRCFDSSGRPIGVTPTAGRATVVRDPNTGNYWIADNAQVRCFDSAGRPMARWCSTPRTGTTGSWTTRRCAASVRTVRVLARRRPRAAASS
jgi:hypothetical protein